MLQKYCTFDVILFYRLNVFILLEIKYIKIDGTWVRKEWAISPFNYLLERFVNSDFILFLILNLLCLCVFLKPLWLWWTLKAAQRRGSLPHLKVQLLDWISRRTKRSTLEVCPPLETTGTRSLKVECLDVRCCKSFQVITSFNVCYTSNVWTVVWCGFSAVMIQMQIAQIKWKHFAGLNVHREVISLLKIKI